MKHDDLRRVLSELPRATPRPGFTRRVVAEFDERPKPRLWSWPRLHPTLLTAVAAIVLLLPVGLVVRERHAQERAQEISRERAARQRIELLRTEYQSLERELRDLQRLRSEARPVVGVEGPGDHDYVIDLRNLYARPRDADSESALAQPASYR